MDTAQETPEIRKAPKGAFLISNVVTIPTGYGAKQNVGVPFVPF